MPHPSPAVSRDPLTPALGLVAALITLVGLVLSFLAPPDVQQGYLSRILPVHVSGSWLAYLSFVATMGFGLAYLATRRLSLDRLAASSAEIGVVFVVFSLYSGALWGRPTWGAYWVWDARLTTTALLLAVYLGYLMVRGMIEDPHRRARVSAAIGAVAAAGVPINYLSVYWWRGLHQTPTFSVVENQSYLRGNPQLLLAMLVTLAGFTLLYLYLLRLRGALARRQAELEERDVNLELAGAARGTLSP